MRAYVKSEILGHACTDSWALPKLFFRPLACIIRRGLVCSFALLLLHGSELLDSLLQGLEVELELGILGFHLVEDYDRLEGLAGVVAVGALA